MRTPHSQSYAQAETAYCSNLHADTTLISLPLGNAPVVSPAQFSHTCAVRQAAAHAAVRPAQPGHATSPDEALGICVRPARPATPRPETPPHRGVPGLAAPCDPPRREPVRLHPKTRNHSRCYSRNNTRVPERFASIGVRQVHLNKRDARVCDLRRGIPQPVTVVRERGRIEDNRRTRIDRLVQPADELGLIVGLTQIDSNAGGGCLELAPNIGKRCTAVHLGLTRTQTAKVGTVKHEDCRHAASLVVPGNDAPCPVFKVEAQHVVLFVFTESRVAFLMGIRDGHVTPPPVVVAPTPRTPTTPERVLALFPP